MAGSQDLQSLIRHLEKSRLSEAVKKAILRQSLLKKACDETNKRDEEKTLDCNFENKSAAQENAASEIIISNTKNADFKSSSEMMEVQPNHSSNCSDAPNPGAEGKTLDSIIDWTNQEDLLCKISLAKNVENSEVLDDSDSESKFLNFQFQADAQEFDPTIVVNNNFSLSLFEKLKVPALQIGMAIPEPVLEVEKANFSKSVTRILKAIKFFGPSCIQSVAWPAVERGRDIIIVAPPHSGKTVSYVLPLVSRFCSAISKPDDDKGPHTIILCSSWRKAHAVNDYLKLFLGNIKKKVFNLFTNGGHYKNKVQSLIDNCDILIATPHCLFEFFQKKLISFTRLEEFVVDDGSAIMERHKKELKEIILCIMAAMKKTECSPQLIFCTERWNKNFQIIYDKVMRNPLIVFTSFLEAAIYARIPIIAHVCETGEVKRGTIYGIVKSSAQKVVICTTHLEDAVEVHQFLSRLRCNSYLVTEDMKHFVADDVIKSWKAASNGTFCLVVTDQIVTDVRINNADCLIHFDIPSKSRLQFGNRFSTIADRFANKESNSKCASHVLILESEHNHAMNLVEIIENSGGVPTQKLVEISKGQSKEDTVSGDLCYYMKAFGVCKDNYCKKRHVIVPDLDKPQIVPYEGDLHAVVTHIVDASHYYVRLVKYLDPVSNKTVSLIGAYARIGFQLKDFYCRAPGEMKVETPVIGESYVLEEENKLFFRVKVLEFIPESETHVALWKVLYVDEGWIKKCKVPKFYKLTDEIELPNPLAVEVYACNMAPADSSFDWNPQTSQLTCDLLKGKEIHGKIVLCIGKTLWLDPLAVTVRLSDGHYIYPFKIDQKLMDYGHVVKKKSHLELLITACTGKIRLPEYTKRKDKEEKVEEPELGISYAFLECNVLEDVYVSCVVSPDNFYVQRAKFVECLDDLLDKINSQVESRKLKLAYTVFKNMVCVAPFFEDNRYYRAIVTDVLSDESVSVFFVDFGDSATVSRKEIFSISAEFLLLPFQAIECELVGIKASHGGWTESAVKSLTFLTRDEALDMKIVQLKAYSKITSYTSGNRYMADLWDCDKKISEKLVQEGYCVPVDFSNEEYWDSEPVQTNTNTNFDWDESCPSPTDEDEELDQEDKNIHAQFYGVVAKMLGETYDMFPLPKKPGDQDSEDEEEILKNIRLNSFSSKVQGENMEKIHPRVNEFKNFEPSSPPIDCVKPLITWWDTPLELNILINLRDIKIYELDLNDERLNFNTVIAGLQYSTEEILYEKILSSEAEASQTIQGVKIIAKKCTPFKWPRLTKEKRKFFHIKYDLLHLEDSDDEDTSKTNDKLNIPPEHVYDDKDSSSTDEDEKYVEPWKDFAQYKDPVDNLLSEI